MTKSENYCDSCSLIYKKRYYFLVPEFSEWLEKNYGESVFSNSFKIFDKNYEELNIEISEYGLTQQLGNILTILGKKL